MKEEEVMEVNVEEKVVVNEEDKEMEMAVEVEEKVVEEMMAEKGFKKRDKEGEVDEEDKEVRWGRGKVEVEGGE